MPDKSGPVLTSFLSGCRGAIRSMREAGLSETLIACVLTEIRSAAILEEATRVRQLAAQNPPCHFGHSEMMKAIRG